VIFSAARGRCLHSFLILATEDEIEDCFTEESWQEDMEPFLDRRRQETPPPQVAAVTIRVLET
jgi:hypothetical protein